MKNLLLFSLLSCFFLEASAQSWTEIYQFQDYNSLTDIAQITVSADDVILAGVTKQFNQNKIFPLVRSTDAGQNWTTLEDSLYFIHADFDSQGNLYMIKATPTTVSTAFSIDSVWYSSDLGDTWTAVYDHTNRRIDVSTYYVDQQDHFYCQADGYGPSFTKQLIMLKNGIVADTLPTPFDVTGKSQRGLIRLTNGNYVTSTFNDGVFWSDDNGQTWNESQNDGALGNTTFTSFAEAQNGALFLGGPSIVTCTDGGETWAASNATGARFIDKVKVNASGQLFAMSGLAVGGLWTSTDNGTTWTQMANLPTFTKYNDFTVSDRYAYLAVDDKLYRMPTGSVQSIKEEGPAVTFEIQPLPQGNIQVKYAENERIDRLRLSAISGKILLDISAHSNTAIIPAHLFDGAQQMYIITMEVAGKFASRKLIR